MRILSLALIAITTICLAANDIHIANEPDKVVVFRKGAEVTFLFKANLKKGVNSIVIDSMPGGLEADKINISEKTGLPISSIFYITEKRKENLTPDEKIIKQIKDSIEVKNDLLLKVESKVTTFEEEISLIKNFKLGNDNLKVENLVALTNFYNKRINEIKIELIVKSKEKLKLQVEVELLNRKWSEIANGSTPLKTQMQYKFNVFAYDNGTSNFKLVYFDTRASWKPYYEIRIKDINSPIIFSLNASVTQMTGYNWNEVNLELSNKAPNNNNSLPSLTPIYIERRTTYYKKTEYNNSNDDNNDDSPLSPKISSSYVREKEIDLESTFPKIAVVNSTVESQTLNMVYKLNNKESIKSNDDEQRFQLIDIEAPANYEYYAVPKKDPNAYLIAKIANYGSYNLTQGESKVYFEGTFVGNSYINSNSIDDTLSIPLGRDEEIQLKRENIKEFSSSIFLSSKVEQGFGNRITIKNNKKKGIKITLMDQIPVRKFDGADVEIEDISGANINEQTGFLTWKVEVDKNEKKTIDFKYKVTATSNAVVPR